MSRLKVTISFEIEANANDDEEVKEEIVYALHDMIEEDTLEFDVEDADMEDEW